MNENDTEEEKFYDLQAYDHLQRKRYRLAGLPEICLTDLRATYTPNGTPRLPTRTHAGETWTLCVPPDASEDMLRKLDVALLIIQGQTGIEAQKQD